VLLEREYAQPVGNQFASNLNINIKAIREIGAEHIILATDSGQVNTPYWCDAVKESISYYRNAGITEEELKMMMIHNPSKVLNL